MHEWGGLTRFAKSEIHQSTCARGHGAAGPRGRRRAASGVASTNEFTPEGARRPPQSAKEMAEIVGARPAVPGPGAGRADVRRWTGASTGDGRRLARGSAPRRSADLIGRCAPGSRAAGAYETDGAEVGLANTEGQCCWAPVHAGVGHHGDVGRRRAAAGSPRPSPERSTRSTPAAIGAARRRQGAWRPVAAAPSTPGVYPVVLEPAAVATLVGFLAASGSAGKGYLEGRSLLQRQEGPAGGGAARSRSGTTARDPRTLGRAVRLRGRRRSGAST